MAKADGGFLLFLTSFLERFREVFLCSLQRLESDHPQSTNGTLFHFPTNVTRHFQAIDRSGFQVFVHLPSKVLSPDPTGSTLPAAFPFEKL